MGLDTLDLLRSIQAVGEPGQLVVTFGPHAGETHGQIAQSDADYLRRLATTAQRAEVRAAAARLMEALPSRTRRGRGVRAVDRRTPACQRCLQLEEELRDLRQRLAASGRYVAFSPGRILIRLWRTSCGDGARRSLAPMPRPGSGAGGRGWQG